MPHCPNCNHELPKENARVGATILDEFLREMGGAKKLAGFLVEHFKDTKGDSKRATSLYRMILEMVQAEDKASQHQNHVEEVTETGERGFVMEYVLRDRGLLEEINAVARVRGLLPPPLDVEFAKIETRVEPQVEVQAELIESEFEHV